MIKCDSCGKFCGIDDLIGCGGEDGEEWTECVRCCSDYDLEVTGKVRK